MIFINLRCTSTKNKYKYLFKKQKANKEIIPLLRDYIKPYTFLIH